MGERRALVTGGYGFVGSRLCETLLERGYDVAVIDDLSVGSAENLPPAMAAEVRSLVVDVRDVQTVERYVRELRPNAVFHLAAVHFIPTCEQQPTLAMSVNVAGTQSILEACAGVDIDAVVVASSGAVYTPSTDPHDEGAELGPTDIYGMTKAWTERLSEYFHRSTSTPVGIARLFNVVGPGETNPHLLPAIIEQIVAGDDELRLGNLATRRDYVFSADVAEGLARLSEACVGDRPIVCNLGSEEALTGAELVEHVARAVGRDVTVTTDPERVRESDRPLLVSDCARAREVIGWHAETSIEDAVNAALAQPFATGYQRA